VAQVGPASPPRLKTLSPRISGSDGQVSKCRPALPRSSCDPGSLLAEISRHRSRVGSQLERQSFVNDPRQIPKSPVGIYRISLACGRVPS
jgi:hypothetical protein